MLVTIFNPFLGTCLDSFFFLAGCLGVTIDAFALSFFWTGWEHSKCIGLAFFLLSISWEDQLV